MQIYTPGTEIGVLQPWPFDNPESNYKILFGAPAASGRIDTGGAGYTTRSGLWRCTAGRPPHQIARCFARRTIARRGIGKNLAVSSRRYLYSVNTWLLEKAFLENNACRLPYKTAKNSGCKNSSLVST